MIPNWIKASQFPQEKTAKQAALGLRKLEVRLLQIGPPVSLVILCLVFFHYVLIGDEYIFPWDFVVFMYPVQRFVDDSIRSGMLPLWNPHVLLGYPTIGDPQAATFNPIFFLYHLIPLFPPLSLQTFELLEILFIAGSGVSTYFLAREVGLQRLGGFFAALVFMLGGFFPVHVEHETWVVASSWIPSLFLLANRAFKQAKPAYVVAMGLVFAFSGFAGYPQTTLLSAYLLIFFLLWQSIDDFRHRQFSPILRRLMSLFGALILGLGISSVQLLPSAVLALNTTRGAITFAGVQVGGLEPAAPITLLLPKVFGSDGSIPYLAGEVTHTQKYLGLAPLVLILAGLITSLRRVRAWVSGRSVNFFLVLGVVAFIGSFGERLYIYRAFELLPFMTLFRRPAALFPFALLGAAIVAGTVCDRLAKRNLIAEPQNVQTRNLGFNFTREWDEVRLVLMLAAILSAFYLVGSLRPEALQVLFAAFRDNPPLQRIADPSFASTLRQVCLGMLAFSLGILGLLTAMVIVPQARGLLTLGLVSLTFIDLYTFNADQIFNTNKWNPFQFPLPGIETIREDGLGKYRMGHDFDTHIFNLADVLGTEDMSGYNPLMLRKVNEFLGAIPSINSRLFDILNVKYLILARTYAEKRGPPDTFDKVLTSAGADKVYVPVEPLDPNKFIFRTSTFNNYFQLWENRNVLPRFIAVNQYAVIPDSEQRLALLSKAEFDPEREIILEEPINESLSGRLSGPISILSYRNDAFQIRTRVVDGSMLLFVSVPYYPGWDATVDGKSTHIYIANHAFMAVRLESGEHTVRFAFEPSAFKVGAWITSLSLAFCLLLLLSRSLLRSIARRLPLPLDARGKFAPSRASGSKSET